MSSDIQFDEPTVSAGNPSLHTIDISGAVTHNTPFLIKHGIVKDLKTANKVMVILFVIMVVLSTLIYLFRPSAFQKKYVEDFSAEELQRMHPDMVSSLPSKNQ
jgi:hypothetical protein